MTRDEILALDGRKLDAAVAEKVMGLRLYRVGSRRPLCLDNPKGTLRPVPRYSSDANAARLVLAEVEKWGNEYALVRALRVVEPSLPNVGLEYGEIQVWQVLRLTPKQLCQAALLACMEGA